MARFIRCGVGMGLVAIMIAALFVVRTGQADEPKDGKPKKEAKPPTVMQRKLTLSQKLLEGLAVGDFDKIKKAAEDLSQCVKEATWRINDTEKYLLHSNMFLRDLEDLQKAAEKKNIDAAALAYADMTRSCVKCHKYLREAGIGAAPREQPRGIGN